MTQEIATKVMVVVRLEDVEMRGADPELYLSFAPLTGYHLRAEDRPRQWSCEENFGTEAERRAFIRGLEAGARFYNGRLQVIRKDGDIEDVVGGVEPFQPLSDEKEAAERLRRFNEEDR